MVTLEFTQNKQWGLHLHFETGRSLNGRSEILKMEDLKRGGGPLEMGPVDLAEKVIDKDL